MLGHVPAARQFGTYTKTIQSVMSGIQWAHLEEMECTAQGF